ncbi:MAG TPA: hypothetical protein DDZ51_09560 [Planctomycetaceae bacterium]|nr:hypothetical protein [Planctomycetaceae bacterium]
MRVQPRRVNESSNSVTCKKLADQQSRRRFRLIILYLAVLSPLIIKGTVAVLAPTANSPLDWVDAEFGPRQDYDRFVEQFIAGDVVVISWPGCSIHDPRLDRFTASLRKSRAFFRDGEWLFQRVTSRREVFRQFTSPPMSLTPTEATKRLGSFLLGPDGETTAVVINFNEQGLQHRGRLVPLIRAAAYQYGGAEVETQHLAGPIVDGYEVDLASQRTMSRFAPLSSMVVFCVCLLCLDSMYGALLVFGVACICQALALSVIYYCGGELTALLLVLPPLIQVLAVAGGIHLLNYYFDNSDGSPDDAIRAAVQIGWLPCVLSSVTTAIGLGSLAVSGLAAVREFGSFAAIGVIITLAALLVLIPGIIRWKPVRIPNSAARKPWLIWGKLLSLQLRWAGCVSAGCIAAMIILGIGLANLQASVRIDTMFANDSRLIRDYAWIEENVGAQVPIDVVVRFDTDAEIPVLRQLEILNEVKSLILKHSEVRMVTTCLDFVSPPIFLPDGDHSTQYLSLAEASAGSTGFFKSVGGQKCWRLTAHVSALEDLDYGSILKRMQGSLTSEFERLNESQSATIELSGLMPLVHEIQRQLLNDLFASFLTAFVLIAVVMTIVQAGLISGLIAMIPNVFPSLALFGLLGWLGYPIDIGSIMTASVAMGIAVDETLHFLNFFNRCLDAGSSREEAVLASYQHCGRAMIQTTLICGAGLTIFALGDFVPTARFAWMMVTLLITALIGDLILLPSLLLHPFLRDNSRRERAQRVSDAENNSFH